MNLLLNCDLGETSNSDQLAIESLVMPHIDYANIACGFHAGNALVMDMTVQLAKKYMVAVGAHLSYPDKFHFGRNHDYAGARTYCLPKYQIRLKSHQNNDIVCYVKPMALYNDMIEMVIL